jgi:hypothetical protein
MIVRGKFASVNQRSLAVEFFRLLTPALSSFGEERENYFVGRFPGVGRLHRPTPG